MSHQVEIFNWRYQGTTTGGNLFLYVLKWYPNHVRIFGQAYGRPHSLIQGGAP